MINKRKYDGIGDLVLNERLQKFSAVLFWIADKKIEFSVKKSDVIDLYDKIYKKINSEIRSSMNYGRTWSNPAQVRLITELSSIKSYFKKRGDVRLKGYYEGPLDIEISEYNLFREGDFLIPKLKESEINEIVFVSIDSGKFSGDSINIPSMESYFGRESAYLAIEKAYLNDGIIEEYRSFLGKNEIPTEKSRILEREIGIVIGYSFPVIINGIMCESFFFGTYRRSGNGKKIQFFKFQQRANKWIDVEDFEKDIQRLPWLGQSTGSGSPLFSKQPVENLVLTFLYEDFKHIFPSFSQNGLNLIR